MVTRSLVRVESVTTKRQKKEFIMFPFWLYRKHLRDPYWVPPLISEREEFFDPQRNPFYEHAEVELFLARRDDGQVVGTIAAVLNENHNAVHNEKTGFFGIFETVEDYEVAEALLSTARDWVAARGMERLRGPANFDVNAEYGLLVDGFDSPPVIMMTYNPRYYVDFIERFGFEKAMDLYAYRLKTRYFIENMPPKVKRVAEVARKRYGVVVRKVDMGRFNEEIEKIKHVYNSAWLKNWGAIPMTDAEFEHLALALKQIADPDLLFIAEINGEPVGVSVGLPDLNQCLLHMNGRLFPCGWITFLRYQRKIDGMRLLIMGVLEEHHLKGIESLFYLETAKNAIAKGYETCEMSWILENNYKIRRGIESLGGKIYKTYRIYDLAISG